MLIFTPRLGQGPTYHTKIKGFTLIEILIALMVFAILATITSSTLYYAFNTRTRVSLQTKRLSALQLTISLIQKDCLQALDRPVRSNDMQLFPAFIGQKEYLELTRDGNINPQSMEKRSSLKRIALLCLNNRLIRRTWASLDPLEKNSYEDRVLLNDVMDCHFNYLTHNLQLLSEWRPEALTQNQQKELRPLAIQLNLILKDWGAANLLFPIAGALYATT